MANINIYGDISRETAGFAAKKLLERGQAEMITERFGYFDPQGKKKTKTRNWRRYESLPAASAPLEAGMPPSGQQLTFTDVEVVLEQYGDGVKLTDVVIDTHKDNVLAESMDLDRQLLRECALAKHFYLFPPAQGHAVGLKLRQSHGCARGETVFQQLQVDGHIGGAKNRVVETALGKTLAERTLAADEALEVIGAAAGSHAVLAPAGGLA